MHPVPGVRYGSYTLRKRELRVWTCNLHDEPPYKPDYYEDDYCERFDFDFPPYGCTCTTSARWRNTGEWEYVMESILNRILRDLYMPAIKEMLNTESILVNQLLTG